MVFLFETCSLDQVYQSRSLIYSLDIPTSWFDPNANRWGNFKDCSTLLARLRCFARLHCTTIPFRDHLFMRLSDMFEIGIGYFRDWIFRSHTIIVRPSIRVSCQLLFRHTYSKRRHLLPKLRVNRLPPPRLCWRVHCTWKIKQRGPKKSVHTGTT